jgi:hypothetical protein
MIKRDLTIFQITEIFREKISDGLFNFMSNYSTQVVLEYIWGWDVSFIFFLKNNIELKINYNSKDNIIDVSFNEKEKNKYVLLHDLIIEKEKNYNLSNLQPDEKTWDFGESIENNIKYIKKFVPIIAEKSNIGMELQ